MSLDASEKSLARCLYKFGWSPRGIAERILDTRYLKEFYGVDIEVHQFLMKDLNRQMYPKEVYGILEDVKKEERRCMKKGQ